MKSRTGPKAQRILLATLALLIVGFIWLLRFGYSAQPPGREVSLDQVYRFAGANQIRSAVLLDQDSELAGTQCVEGGKCTQFHAAYPHSDVTTQNLIDRLSASGARVAVDKQTGKAVARLLATFIFPLLMLANLFGLIFLARGDSSLADIAGFGRIGRRLQRKRRATKGVSFADVAGAEEAVTEMREVIDYLANPERFEAYGASVPKGVLLFGPPGCGKTLLARAVAGESGVPFFSVSGTEFVESLVGVGAARVRDLFRQVREVAPAIAFIDEIDAVGRRRAGEGTSGGEREQTLNQLLVEMDGFDISAGIVVIGATNRPDILDPALLRPGRFDRHVTVVAPDIHGRQAILELHGRTRPMSPDVDFFQLARQTSGFTGADLANVINEAALLAIREGGGTKIGPVQLSEAVQRVLHGPQRRGMLMTSDERRRIALHECGHALVATALGTADEVSRVSIVARGRGLGQTAAHNGGDRVLFTARQMRTTLAVALGGRVAEKLILGDVSTGAADDIERATRIAREMVGIFGMSAEIGPVRVLGPTDESIGDDGWTDISSAQTRALLDTEIRSLLQQAEAEALRLLTERRPTLEDAAAVLEREETLEGEALARVLSSVGHATANGPDIDGPVSVVPADARAMPADGEQ